MAAHLDSADAAGLLPGTLVAGPFRIEAALGRGGMANVYFAGGRERALGMGHSSENVSIPSGPSAATN